MSNDKENSKSTTEKIQDVANLLRNETARRHRIISWSIRIIAPMLILLLIAGLFMVVVSSIGEIVTDIVSTMGEFFSGVGTWFTSLFDPDSGKYIITINEEKFDEIKSSLASQGINAEASSLTDECLKLFMLAQYKTQYPEDVRIKIEISAEEKSKIDKRGRGTNIENENGKYYLVAEGGIQLYRPEFNNSSKKLKYTELRDLEAKVQEVKDGAKPFDSVANLYTIDTSGNLVIPRIKSKTTTWQGVDEKQENGKLILNEEKEESEEVWNDFKKDWDKEKIEVVDVDLDSIQYKSQISSYTMPFEFLTILTTFTQNSEYGVAVAELVNDKSTIKLQIQDNSTTKEERQVYQYKSTNIAQFNVGAKAAIPRGQVWVAFDANTNDIREYVGEDDYQMIWKPWNYEKWSSVPTYYVRRKVVATTEYKPSIQLEEADTWYVKKVNDFQPNETTPKKDTNTSPNPNVEDKNNNSELNDIITNFINQDIDKNTYIGLQNLYDTNTQFKKFIDEYYEKDTGKKGVKDFREDSLAALDQNKLKSEMVEHVNGEVIHNLWKRFYEQELGGIAQGYTTEDYIHVIGYEINHSGHATIQQVNKYNKAVGAQDDYLAEDPNWKIDDSTYEIFPTYVANKREERQKITTTYVSERKYTVTNVGKAQDNTDAFIKLLKDNGKYVEYKTTDGRKKPGADLASAPDMLFEILASNPKTANLENAMRYIMYKMTNKDYGVTDFNSAYRTINARRVGADYNVADSSIWITSKQDLIAAIKALGLSAQAEQNLINDKNLEAFLYIQEHYNVNAAFAISVAIVESNAGTEGYLVQSNRYNLMSVPGKYNGNSYKVENTEYRVYKSYEEAILDFGKFVSESGKNTITQIGDSYCSNTEAFPTQSDSWKSAIQANMTKILKEADIDLSKYSGGDASAVIDFARQYVGKGIYDVLPLGQVTSDGVFAYYGDHWCAMFVSYCFDSCGLIPSVLEHSYMGCTSATQDWIDEGKMKPKEYYTPKAGDIIFFGTESRRHHTGIVTDCDGTYVYTIEGNTGSGRWSSSIVKEICYSINHGDIYGYYET